MPKLTVNQLKRLVREAIDEVDLPRRSGMGRRLSESLKTIVRETYEAACMECGYEEGIHEEQEAVEEYLSEKKSKKRTSKK